MELVPMFSVPIWQHDVQNYSENKEKVFSSVSKYRKTENNTSSDIIKEQDLFPIFNDVCSVAHQAAKDLGLNCNSPAITSAWVNIFDDKYSIQPEHIHNDVFTAIFYVHSPEGVGKLCLRNPGINECWEGCKFVAEKNQFTSRSIKVDPIEGMILLFPSYIYHSIDIGELDSERISISFNITLIKNDSE